MKETFVSAHLAWICDNSLNLWAYSSLRLARPLRAKLWIEKLARIYPVFEKSTEATAMMDRLGRRGTCLSRAMAVASRFPKAKVAIGVAALTASAGVSSRRSINAHAWLEIDGVALAGEDQSWIPIAWFRMMDWAE